MFRNEERNWVLGSSLFFSMTLVLALSLQFSRKSSSLWQQEASVQQFLFFFFFKQLSKWMARLTLFSPTMNTEKGMIIMIMFPVISASDCLFPVVDKLRLIRLGSKLLCRVHLFTMIHLILKWQQ